MAPRILIFSIAMGADYSFYMKSIATYAPAFLRYNNSVLAIVLWQSNKPLEICQHQPFEQTAVKLDKYGQNEVWDHVNCKKVTSEQTIFIQIHLLT